MRDHKEVFIAHLLASKLAEKLRVVAQCFVKHPDEHDVVVDFLALRLFGDDDFGSVGGGGGDLAGHAAQ